VDGQVMFSEVVRQGGLVLDSGSGKWVGGGGFKRNWDGCSSTVSLFCFLLLSSLPSFLPSSPPMQT